MNKDCQVTVVGLALCVSKKEDHLEDAESSTLPLATTPSLGRVTIPLDEVGALPAPAGALEHVRLVLQLDAPDLVGVAPPATWRKRALAFKYLAHDPRHPQQRPCSRSRKNPT